MKFGFLTKSLGVTLGALLASTASLYGDYCCDNADSYSYDSGCAPVFDSFCDPCDYGVEVGAEFIHWKPCIDGLDYAYKANGLFTFDTEIGEELPNGKIKNLCHDWVPGFRVNLAKRDILCGLNLKGSYTRLRDKSCKSESRIEDQTLVPTLFHALFIPLDVLNADRIRGKHDFLYSTFDVLLSFDYCPTLCHRISPFFGVEGMKFDQHIKSSFFASLQPGDFLVTQTGRLDWHGDFWGVGLKLGSDYTFRIWDCLSLYAKGSGTILFGEGCNYNKQRFIRTIGETTLAPNGFTTKQDDCLIVPGCHLGVGFRYDTILCNWDLSATLGYEFVQWFNLPKQRRYSESFSPFNQAIGTALSTTHVGFHGWNIGLNVGF